MGVVCWGAYSHWPISLQIRASRRPLATPPADGGPTDAELSGDLLAGEHAGSDQSFLEPAKASLAPIRRPRSLRIAVTCASVYSSKSAFICWRASALVARSSGGQGAGQL
jgi:hypothetical protein